jgi:hypothetical protein
MSMSIPVDLNFEGAGAKTTQWVDDYEAQLPKGSLRYCLIMALKDGYSYVRYYYSGPGLGKGSLFAPVAGMLAKLRDDRKFDDIADKGVWKYLALSAMISPQKSSQNMIGGSLFLYKDKKTFTQEWDAKKVGFKIIDEYDDSDDGTSS